MLTGVTRQVPQVKQDIRTLPEQPSPPTILVGLVWLNNEISSSFLSTIDRFVLFCGHCFSNRLRFTASDELFGIVNLVVYIHYNLGYYIDLGYRISLNIE
jgi:hypothetical protein